MSWFVIFLVVCFTVMGFVIGCMYGRSMSASNNTVGTFRVNMSDPSKELFSISFENDIEDFGDLEYITFRVMKV